jgi:small G protein signaling modulator 3
MSEDEESTLSKSSSSQHSHTSNSSKKAKSAQNCSRGSHSTASGTSGRKPDPSLTSFPSFSPEQVKAQPVAADKVPKPIRTVSQKTRERKATLAGLTSASPSVNRHNALFDDSPRSSFDIPGAVNLASDEHIERLIARSGAVKLVRQYAQDLAQRDAEISSLRNRADNRERELKRLLREADVPSAEIEKRLLRLEQSVDDTEQETPRLGSNRQSPTSMHGMVQEAMSEEVGSDAESGSVIPSTDVDATITHPLSMKSGAVSVHSQRESASSWQFWNSTATSQRSSRANSMVSRDENDPEATVKVRGSGGSTTRARALDAIFQAPGSNVQLLGGKSNTIKKQKAGDEVSVRSNQSGNSFASWTKLFGGATNSKDAAGRARSNSNRDDGAKTSAATADSAMAALSKVRTNPAKSNTASSQVGTVRQKPNRVPTSSNLSATSSDHVRKNSESQALGPVEMDAILPEVQRPPTMTHTSNIDVTYGLLTDRFGFIFDQRQQKRRSLGVKGTHHKKLSGVQTLGNFRKDSDDGMNSGGISPPKRSATPQSMDEDSKKSWQDYLKIPANIGRPRELLSHTPSAGAIVTVNTAEGTITPPSGLRSASIGVAAKSALEPKQSNVTASSAGFASLETEQANDKEPVKLLLEQLTELHDSLQSEKEVKWNAFLARVRAERAANAPTASERVLNNAPEAVLLNGELIGIASLGRSPKTKNKYLQFKTLVLAGIPVSLRPKIWAECSGASSLRIPSYYDDLVARSHEGTEIDPDIAQQIFADIRRTLTDNTFFRYGPGVERLEELLRAYSLHNPLIGYCQGMNLITASLLLICATAEECFWLLVSIIDQILPSGYFDQSLLVARADQIVLRGYVAEILPKLDAKLSELGVELEAVTFNWFLSLYSGVLTGGEALYRVWDVVLCLNSSEEDPNALRPATADDSTGKVLTPLTPSFPADESGGVTEHDGTSSPFLFQLSLALLKLNEAAILNLDSAAMVYSYVNHNMTNHAITVDGLVQAAEALRIRIKRKDVLERRARAVKELGG